MATYIQGGSYAKKWRERELWGEASVARWIETVCGKSKRGEVKRERLSVARWARVWRCELGWGDVSWSVAKSSAAMSSVATWGPSVARWKLSVVRWGRGTECGDLSLYAPGQATFIFCMVFLSLLRFCPIFVRATLKNLRQDQVAFSESATFYVIVVFFPGC